VVTAPPGVILDSAVTSDAIVATLDEWMPQLVAHLARLDSERRGPAGLTAEIAQPPASYHQTEDPVEDNGVLWPARALPAVYVIYDQLADDPVHDGDGKYSVRHRFEVGAVVQGPDQDAAYRFSQLYYMAIVGCLMQQDPSLGGHAAGVNWRTGTAARRPRGAEGRPLAVCAAMFEVDVADVIDVFDSLPAPMPGTPPAEAPERETFQSVEITVEPKEAE
jgi:hypothetical protein